MDTEKRTSKLNDLLEGSQWSAGLRQMGRSELLIPLPAGEKERLLHTLAQGGRVLLLPAQEEIGEDILALSLSAENMALLDRLEQVSGALERDYGCRSLCLAEGRLLGGKVSSPLLLHPVTLEKRAGQWRLEKGGDTLLNPVAMGLLSDSCPVPEDGWSYQGSVLAGQLDAAIAAAPGCVREEGFYLGLFPLWVLTLDRALSQPAPRHSLAAGLESGTVRAAAETKDGELLAAGSHTSLIAPLPLDSKQRQALEMALQGEHLLLSGQKGTGKTHTAAALAANAMAKGDRTLFIAARETDREAALEQMKQLGLDKLTLHIPASGDRKQAVLHQYNVAAQIQTQQPQEDLYSLTEESDKLRGRLDRHLTALHTPGRCGLTPWELICRYLEVRETEGIIDLPPLMVGHLEREDLEAVLSAAEDLTLAAQAVGNTADHPLSFLEGGEYDPAQAEAIPQLANELHSAMKAMETAAADWCGLTGQSYPVSEADWTHVAAAGRCLLNWADYPAGWRTSPRVPLLPEAVKELRSRLDRADRLEASIRSKWEEEIFQLDCRLLDRQWRQLQEGWQLPTDPDREETLVQLLAQGEGLLAQLERAGRRWAAATRSAMPTTRDSWERSYEVALELARWKEIPREWGSCSNLRALLWDVSELIRHGKQAKESKEVLLRNWSPSLLSLEGRSLLNRWEREGGSWGLSWLSRQNAVRSQMEPHFKGEKLSSDEMERGLRWLVDFQDELEQCQEIEQRWHRELQSVYRKEETSWIWLENARVVAAESHDWLAELTGSQDFLRQFGSSSEAVSAAQELQSAWEKTREVLGRMDVVTGRHSQPDTNRWLTDRQLDCRRLRNLIRVRRQLEELSKGPLALGDIPQALGELARHQKERSAIAALADKWSAELEEVYTGADTDWEALYERSVQAAQSDEALSNITGDLELRLRLAGDEEAQAAAMALCSSHAAFRAKLEQFTRLTRARMGRGLGGNWLALLRGDIAMILEHLPMLESWMNYLAQRQRCEELDLHVFAAHFDQPIPEGEDTFALFRKSLYRGLLVLEMEWVPDLRTFSARKMGETLRRFGRVEALLQTRVREHLFYDFAKAIPTLPLDEAYQEELGLLLWANQPQGRDLSAEELVSSLPKLTHALFAAVIASPTDALACFGQQDGEEPPFRYAVLEEAGGLPATLGQALTALGQTSLLLSRPGETDYPMLEQEQSIWSRCSGYHLPEIRLEQSYLLRGESLQWADRELYGLTCLPTPEPQRFDLEYKTVVGQMKDQTNPAEAAAVVTQALRLLDEGEQELAIAALTHPQRDLISAMLVQTAQESPQRQEQLARLPVLLPRDFGSRRFDRLLVSLTLAPGKRGGCTEARKLAGLWKDLAPIAQLLAAARKQVWIFSSLDRQDWPKLGSPGLSRFLAYAQNQTPASEPLLPCPDRIRQEVCRRFEQAGYKALPGQEPLAIRVYSPEEPGRCLLGILMDGAGYGAIRDTRERELDRTALLQAQGWNLCRLWSLDWLQDSDRVMAQMLRLLEAIREQESLPPLPREKAPAPAQPPLYTPAELTIMGIRDEELTAPAFRNRVGQVSQLVLKSEGPMPDFRLTERVLTAFGLDAGDEVLCRQCGQLWSALEITATVEEERTFLWSRETAPEFYTGFRVSGQDEHFRAPEEVSRQEAANAAAWALRRFSTLTPLRLAQETARLLGYDPENEAALDCGRRGVEYGMMGARFHETSIGTLV